MGYKSFKRAFYGVVVKDFNLLSFLEGMLMGIIIIITIWVS